MQPESQGHNAPDFTAATITLAVTVERLLFRARQTGYTVAVVMADDQEAGAFKAVGHLPPLEPGNKLQLRGRWGHHPRYGRQFQVQEARLLAEDPAGSVIQLLGSGLVPQLGPALAKNIVTTLGPDAIQKVLAESSLLAKVPGIGAKKAQAIAQGLAREAATLQAAADLTVLGIPAPLALALCRTYGADSFTLLQEEPYDTCLSLPGVSFATVDDLIQRLGWSDLAGRLQALIVHVVREAAQRHGHPCLPMEVCRQEVAQYLRRHRTNPPEESLTDQDDSQLWAEAVANLIHEGRLKCSDDKLYLPHLWEAESSLLADLERLLAARGKQAAQPVRAATAKHDGRPEEVLISPRALDASLGGLLPAALTDRQRQAVTAALTEPFSIITGGPGTGKTTVVSSILKAFTACHDLEQVLLAAPTGRAAHRLAELTGHEAATIHRLLEYNVDEQGGEFRRHRDNPLSGLLLIIDEASMLDLPLAAHLFEAVPAGMAVVLVGDTDQLPSVGPGNILGDLIAAKIAPVVHLDEVFRQSGPSNIILNAHRVRDGQPPLPVGDKDDLTADFRLLTVEDDRSAAQTVMTTVKELLAAELVSSHECQVLVPVWRGPAGVHQLNARLQAALNPPAEDKPFVSRGEQAFRVGDRVMCTRNLYTKGSQGIFNGHVGVIEAIHGSTGEETLHIDFDGETVEFGVDELVDLELAYACTVHKAQGSEFEAVVLCLLRRHNWLLNRNLLYTAMTRARRWLIIVADEGAVEHAVGKARGRRRHTALADRLAAQLSITGADGV